MKSAGIPAMNVKTMCNCNSIRSCNCSSITTQKGETGNDGSTTVITYNTTEVITTTNNKVYTLQRLNNASDSIAPASSGYDWRILTVPSGIATANLLVCEVNIQTSATDTHFVTLGVKRNGAAVANLTRQQSCVTDGASAKVVVSFQFELVGVVTGDTIDVNIISSSGVVSAVFKGGHGISQIYQ